MPLGPLSLRPGVTPPRRADRLRLDVALSSRPSLTEDVAFRLLDGQGGATGFAPHAVKGEANVGGATPAPPVRTYLLDRVHSAPLRSTVRVPAPTRRLDEVGGIPALLALPARCEVADPTLGAPSRPWPTLAIQDLSLPPA